MLLVFPLMIMILPFISWLTEINRMAPLPHALELAETRAEVIVNLFMSDGSLKGLFLNLLMIGVLPAIGEELFFRGVIQQQLSKGFRNPHVAVWVTAILFSFFHFQFHGFLPRMFLGVIFGYLFVWTGSLWLPVLAHLVNNGGAVMVEFLAQRNVIRIGYSEFGVHQGAGEVVISALATILICVAIWYAGSRHQRQSLPLSNGHP
jgi:membrane protease YdiL (CAAX protease family)